MPVDISTIKISQPAHRAFQGAGITTLEQLAAFREADLLALHGFGPKGLKLLKAALAEHGLALKKDGGE